MARTLNIRAVSNSGHIEIVPLQGDLAGMFGLKSKTNKFFGFYYKSVEQAQRVANRIDSRWDSSVNSVNFSYRYPVSPARGNA